MNRRFARRIGPAEAGRRLDDWAQEWLSQALGRPVPRSEVRRWIMAGAVRMEGARPRQPASSLVEGRRVEARIRPEAAARPPERTVSRIDASCILFEDAWLLAVDKPAGLPTHETADPRRPHLVGLLAQFLADRSRAGGGVPNTALRLGVHQRLDRDTSGVILFSKDRAADPGLARQFAERTVSKAYQALTVRPDKPPPERWTATGPLPRRGPGPDHAALTEFRLVESFDEGLLVEARPRTGRKHQIRIHLAAAGLPILGDDRYGPRRAERPDAPRLMLHACRLELRHPVTGGPLVIESPWPSDFRRMVDDLRVAGRGQPPGRRPRR